MKNRTIREIQPTEMIGPPLLRKFLVHLETVETTDDVWNLLLELCHEMGLSALDYVYATDFRNWQQAQFIRTTASSKWLDYVRKYPTIRQTSVFRRHCVHYLTPVLCGPAHIEMMGDVSEAMRIHGEATKNEVGMNAGISFPLRMDDPGQAASLAWGGPHDRFEFAEVIREHGWTMHAASLSAHTRYTELFKAEFIERNELTEKQRELIKLVGKGLMDKQIAHELDISFSAVRQRLARVQSKTGVQNRAELAALAMRVGLVPDPLLRPHSSDLTVFLSMADGKTGAERIPDPARAAE